MRGIGILALVVILGWCAPHARSDIVNDGCYHQVALFQIRSHGGVGQSFVATDEYLRVIGIGVSAINASLFPRDRGLTLELYEGEGFDGAMIGSLIIVDIPYPYDGLVLFRSQKDVELSIGATYTAYVFDVGSIWGAQLTFDAYDDGTAWFAGDPQSIYDVRFRVFTDDVAEPPPCTLDLYDLLRLVACMDGPGILQGNRFCRVVYADDDKDVDLAEFARFQNEFTGAVP